MFKVSGLTISEAGKTAVVMVSADAGESYQFFENVSIEDDSITSLKVQRNIYAKHRSISNA